MKYFEKIQNSYNSKIDIGYAFIRIFLGIALFIRGWMILSKPSSILELGVEQEDYIVVIIVGIVHSLGGILLTLGFLTRLGAFIQIPILFTATFFVYAQSSFMMGGQSIELASLVLFLLLIFFIFGSGPLSVRQYLENKKN